MKASVFFVSALLLSAAGASAQNNSTINDAQIASIVVTANQVDIDAGKLAASTSTTPEVKKFAAVDGHRPHRREQAGGRSGDAPEGHTTGQRHQQEPEGRR
jgi:predicted outer membrane protein